MSTAIICAVLIVIAIIGIKSYAKKLTSGCCGASSQPSVKKMKVRDKDKSHYPYSRLLKVVCPAVIVPAMWKMHSTAWKECGPRWTWKKARPWCG